MSLPFIFQELQDYFTSFVSTHESTILQHLEKERARSPGSPLFQMAFLHSFGSQNYYTSLCFRQEEESRTSSKLSLEMTFPLLKHWKERYFSNPGQQQSRFNFQKIPDCFYDFATKCLSDSEIKLRQGYFLPHKEEMVFELFANNHPQHSVFICLQQGLSEDYYDEFSVEF